MLGEFIKEFKYKGCSIEIRDASGYKKDDEKYLMVEVNYLGDKKYRPLGVGSFDLMEDELEQETAENMAKNYVDFLENEYGFSYLLEVANDIEEDPLMSDGIEWDIVRWKRDYFLKAMDRNKFVPVAGLQTIFDDDYNLVFVTNDNIEYTIEGFEDLRNAVHNGTITLAQSGELLKHWIKNI